MVVVQWSTVSFDLTTEGESQKYSRLQKLGVFKGMLPYGARRIGLGVDVKMVLRAERRGRREAMFQPSASEQEAEWRGDGREIILPDPAVGKRELLVLGRLRCGETPVSREVATCRRREGKRRTNADAGQVDAWRPERLAILLVGRGALLGVGSRGVGRR